MVIASHAIFATYGFWLPNEQRGSWSTEVWAPNLIEFGPATKTEERRSLARRPFDRAKRAAAREALKYPAVEFTGLQARAVARGFAQIIERLGLIVYACAIMRDHVHIVPERHDLPIEDVVGHLKRAATRELTHEGLHPLAEHRNTRGRVPSPWVEHGWYRFLDNPVEVSGAIDYANDNPVKQGMKKQQWSFVQEYGLYVPTPRGRGG